MTNFAFTRYLFYVAIIAYYFISGSLLSYTTVYFQGNTVTWILKPELKYYQVASYIMVLAYEYRGRQSSLKLYNAVAGNLRLTL